MNVFIIGIGLIGGSFAIDIKAAFDDAKIYGIDESEPTRRGEFPRRVHLAGCSAECLHLIHQISMHYFYQ